MHVLNQTLHVECAVWLDSPIFGESKQITFVRDSGVCVAWIFVRIS
jgi:hypothetical protein